MTTLLEALNIKVPVWSAGMGLGIAGAKLASAVSEAGGLGVLGAGGLPGSRVHALIDEMRSLTDRAFGANIILPLSDGTDIAACFDARVPLIVLFWGDPQPYVADAKRRGIKVISQCGSGEEAVAAADCGVDGVIVQGTEAGGHVKALAPLATTVADSLGALGPIPVIASGGIATGADIATAMKTGACAVSMGTRFLASTEARVLDDYKARVIKARAQDTVLTDLFDLGWPNANHRVIRNAAYDEWESAGKPASGERPGETEIIGQVTIDGEITELPRYTVYPPATEFEGDIESVPLYAGESCERILSISPAADIMETLIEEYRQAL